MTGRPPHDAALGDACGCFRCHINGVQFSPAATPTRKSYRSDPGPKLCGNSWENGVVRDDRNMPYLDSNGTEIGTKKWVDSERRKFQDAGLA